MNNKQSEEKQRIFLNMLDHPEKYTTKEIEALLADEEISSFASYLAMTKRAMKRHEDEDIDVNAEWEHFAIEHSIPQDVTGSGLRHLLSVSSLYQAWRLLLQFSWVFCLSLVVKRRLKHTQRLLI